MKLPDQTKSLVLIAEDDPDDRLLVEEALSPFANSLTLQFVENGEGLMEWLHLQCGHGDPDSLRPRLILLNVNMPGKDGIQALEEIKQDAALKQIPVIMWTTSSDECEGRLCLEAGAEGYLTKPNDFSDLAAALRNVVDTWLK